MAKQTREDTGAVPDILYHTLLFVTDYNDDTSGFARSTYPLGTHTSRQAAGAFASKALQGLNYQPEDFESYSVRTPSTVSWPHGDDAVAYGRVPGGREFLVEIGASANNPRLAGGPDGVPRLPAGADPLQYVIRTRTDYLQDRPGRLQTTEVHGVYLHRKDAVQAARMALAEDRAELAQYDEQVSPGLRGEWPFGDDVVVHAVAQTGENIAIAVRTVPGAMEKHAKSAKGAGRLRSI